MQQFTQSQIVDSVTSAVVRSLDSLVYGQPEAKRLLVGSMIIGGHVLLEGPPGIAKTLLAKSFAEVIGLSFKRIQFTPDLMPTDVTGVYIFDQGSNSFRLVAGPIFADIVLGDEINRTPPKTQAALLEAMQERIVTIDGRPHPLSELFFVIATQNPIEHEGTYPLPEAQLDRFLFKVNMTYPARDYEVAMISTLSGATVGQAGNTLGQIESGQRVAIDPNQILDARAALRAVELSDKISDYIYRLAEATRKHNDLVLGISPRAALNLALASKFEACCSGRDYVIPDDVKAVANCVLVHRLVVSPELYGEARGAERILGEILSRVPVPSN